MTIKEIDQALEEGESLKSIAQAFSDIANLKIKRIRNAVERNRLFFDEIATVYATVKALAIKKKIAIVKPKDKLCILTTSNNRFYGAITQSLVKYFIGSTRQLQDADRIILGKGGIDYFRVFKVLPNYQEVVLKDDMPTSLELAHLASLCTNYNQVLVFHAKFKSLLTQQATLTDISQLSFYINEFRVKSIQTGAGENFFNFIFEPELAKMLKFFDSQILTLLLEQTFLESELSRTASRFIYMDQAEGEANKFIKQYQALKAYTKAGLINGAILENYASMMAVRKAVYG